MGTQISTNKKLSIMVVEDEIDALQLLSAVLEVKYPDISFYTAINGKTGLELFETHLPAIVITDINMPEMCGNRLADKIIETNPGTKLIAITGKSCNISSDNISSDFQHIIEKPVDFKELFTVIDQCIGELKRP
jgi:YesN/AraC family two-component response regulator